MCYDKSWFVSQDKANDRKAAMKDKRSETVDTLLRQSQGQAQKAAAGQTPAKEPAPAK